MSNQYFTFGYERFGPFLYGFARWLRQELKDRGYEKVFFFSRDGYMLQKAFDAINDAEIVSKYVYFSRKSLSQPLLHRASSFEESLEYLAKERYVSFGKLLEYYGYDEQERKMLAAKGGYTLEEAVPFEELKSNTVAMQIYEACKDVINKRSQEQDGLLAAYLEQVGMRGRFAIVDIGWHGTMQRNLETYYRICGYDTNFEGFYIGILPNKPLMTKTHGYIYDETHPKQRKQISCFLGICERLLQSMEGSSAGYSLVENKVVPRLLPYEYANDETVIQAIQSWQSGAICYLEHALKEKADTPDSELIKPLFRFGKRPSLQDTKLFTSFYNFDGTKVYYTAQKTLFRYRLKELKYGVANSPWKTGFMKSLFKIPFPYYEIYCLMKR